MQITSVWDAHYWKGEVLTEEGRRHAMDDCNDKDCSVCRQIYLWDACWYKWVKCEYTPKNQMGCGTANSELFGKTEPFNAVSTIFGKIDANHKACRDKYCLACLHQCSEWVEEEQRWKPHAFVLQERKEKEKKDRERETTLENLIAYYYSK